MNHVNWVQQEQDIEYHVIKWKNSAFHDHHIHKRPGAGGMQASGLSSAPVRTEQGQLEGFALGILDSTRGGKYKSGGLGENGRAEDGRESGQKTDGVTISANGTKQQQALVQNSENAVPVNEAPDTGLPVHMAQSAAVGTSRKRSGGGFKEKAQKYKETYKKYRKKLEKILKKNPRNEEDKPQKGTRSADKEQVLSMQAENHYLLDSYDKNGQYHMLGK